MDFKYYQVLILGVKVLEETLITDKFALGWCGIVEEVKAVTFIASDAGESFLDTFLRKKSICLCQARGQESLCVLAKI